jgi:hypothetical protein
LFRSVSTAWLADCVKAADASSGFPPHFALDSRCVFQIGGRRDVAGCRGSTDSRSGSRPGRRDTLAGQSAGRDSNTLQ